MLSIGDPVPGFTARSSVNPTFHFDTVAGRYVVLSFFGSASSPTARRLLDDVRANSRLFDVRNAIFCGVTSDPADELLVATATAHPGILLFADFDRSIADRFRLRDRLSDRAIVRPTTFILDEGLRVLAVLPWSADETGHFASILAALRQQPPLAKSPRTAPVLVLDRIFEPELCRQLVRTYESTGGYDSGFMRDINGKTTGIVDHGFKRRADCDIADPDVIRQIHIRLHHRLIPEIFKAFNFRATRIERHIVACYDATIGGYFRAHRDNTSLGTAHRRFAVSINLNSEDFEGGNLCFPEFGPRVYRPSTGGAVVFGCSLLHEATPVTRGRRYAFLPFLYDDAAAAIRQRNRHHISGESINLNTG